MSAESPSPTDGDTNHKRIADDRDDIPHHAQLLGVDATGAVHFHSPRADRVWVVDPDPASPVDSVITHVKDVLDIWAWVEHTERCRGWDDLRYHRGSWIDAVVEHIADAEAQR